MNKMKPHSASKVAYELRMLIIECVKLNKSRYIDIKNYVHSKQPVSERSQQAHISNAITRLVDVGCLKIRDTKAKAQDRYWYTWTGIEYTPTVREVSKAVKYEKEKITQLEGETKEQAKAREAEEAARAERLHGSAMLKVKDLAKKLKETSELRHSARQDAPRRQRIGCGISQVYEGW